MKGKWSDWLLWIWFLLSLPGRLTSSAATLSWEKITEAGWIPDNLVEIKSCLIQFLSKYWTHFEFSQQPSLPVQSDEEHIRLTTNQSSEIIKMEQFISRPGSSFPCLQLQVVAHLHERLAVFNQKVHGDSGWWISPKLSDSWVPGMITRSYFWSEKGKGSFRGYLELGLSQFSQFSENYPELRRPTSVCNCPDSHWVCEASTIN